MILNVPSTIFQLYRDGSSWILFLWIAVVSIHVVVRFTHAYRDFVADNNYAIFIQIPGLFKRQRLKNVFLITWHVLKNSWFTNSFGNRQENICSWVLTIKSYFIVTKRLHLVTARLSKGQRNQIIGVLRSGSTVNGIAHHFCCSRQTIYNLMNRYNKTGSVRDRARPGRANVTTLPPYRVNTLIHPRNRFNQQPFCSALTGFMHKRSLIFSCKITDLAFSAWQYKASHNA